MAMYDNLQRNKWNKQELLKPASITAILPFDSYITIEEVPLYLNQCHYSIHESRASIDNAVDYFAPCPWKSTTGK